MLILIVRVSYLFWWKYGNVFFIDNTSFFLDLLWIGRVFELLASQPEQDIFFAILAPQEISKYITTSWNHKKSCHETIKQIIRLTNEYIYIYILYPSSKHSPGLFINLSKEVPQLRISSSLKVGEMSLYCHNIKCNIYVCVVEQSLHWDLLKRTWRDVKCKTSLIRAVRVWGLNEWMYCRLHYYKLAFTLFSILN